MQLRVPASRLSTIGVIIDITWMPVPQMAHQGSISLFVRVGRNLPISFLTVFVATSVLITDVIELKECLNQCNFCRS